MKYESLLTDLWTAQFGERYSDNMVSRFWQRDLAIARKYTPAIFGASDKIAIPALLRLIHGVSAGKGREQFGLNMMVPRAWFHLFYSYYERGLITPAVWGCAARNLYVVSPPGPGSVLAGFRAAQPKHLMKTADRVTWLRRPPFITAYRGACASTLNGVWQGVSWTLDPDHAAEYARGRTVERYDVGDHVGLPRCVEAKLPRDAILAILEGGKELLVDYERVHPSMVKELAPVPANDVPAVIAQLVAECAATLHIREAAGVNGFLDA